MVILYLIMLLLINIKITLCVLMRSLNSWLRGLCFPFFSQESSCTQGPLAVPAPARAAPPVGTRHSHRLPPPSHHLQRRLRSQRLGRLNIGQLGPPHLPLNWYSSSQRSTVPPQWQPLLSTPTRIPSQQRGHAVSREHSQVSHFSTCMKI